MHALIPVVVVPPSDFLALFVGDNATFPVFMTQRSMEVTRSQRRRRFALQICAYLSFHFGCCARSYHMVNLRSYTKETGDPEYALH